MQFLKTLFWVLVAVVGVIFSLRNWTPVTLNLWAGLQLDTQLPVLLLLAFLAGLVPMLLIHRATRWSMRRRIESMERSLAERAATPRALPTVVPTP